MTKYLRSSSYISKPFFIDDSAPDPIPSEFPYRGKFSFLFYQWHIWNKLYTRLPRVEAKWNKAWLVRLSKWIPSHNFSIIKFRGHLLARVARILWIVASEGAREAVVIRVTVVFTQVVCTQAIICTNPEKQSLHPYNYRNTAITVQMRYFTEMLKVMSHKSF